MLDAIFRNICNPLIKAIFTLPDQKAIVYAIILLLIYGLIVLPLGFYLKFLEFEIVTNWQKILQITVTSLFAPAILEEIFFRILILPPPSEKLDLIFLFGLILLGLLLFVIYHPLNAYLFFPPARRTFYNPVFLFFAFLLGLICSISYLQSGSLWIPVAIHWLIVIIWLLVLGGLKQLNY